MADQATPNLPAIDFEATSQFYRRLGFEQRWRDDSWMIMTRGSVKLEFFHHPGLNPGESWFSCCLRMDDLDGFYAVCQAAGVPEQSRGWPRLHPATIEKSGLRMGALIDLNGTLLRLIQN
ncbi:bleomycin resistance protein [Myxococcus sp. Y35]|uniref:bleomycin resistance protein n=1 Tax=Pseudomyxococcus flavus TaxID=3115648 RepID=UPI003CEA3B35